MSADALIVNEIYLSLQGESTFAGLPCIFVRLTACNLRCSYCDTAYAFTEGKRTSIADILSRIEEMAVPFAGKNGQQRLPLIEFTGGEPLLQPRSAAVMRELCDRGFTVLVETSGAHDISVLDARVRRIMDLKCPSSGEDSRNLWSNLPHLRATDEIKFVVGTRQDYAWVKEQIRAHQLDRICPLLISWVHPLKPEQQHPSLKPVPEGQDPLPRSELVDQIIADALPVRFQLQMHKILWPPDQRGV